ncbi:hypothetical protein LSUE1_G000036 [Lachnellula suecica]|uniref:DUF6594 domain-containing protein n=1 Tax=Lachnellula suecica TaxID=602035 RepID=A0A8T9CHU5_9HELO|nr:hypothetical protein LSUE1_G000036 [Lachnellula suecica]
MAEHELQPSGPPPSYHGQSRCHICGGSNPLPGWPQVTKTIVDNPGLEAFPLYRNLNIKSLLYYQAELDRLQSELHDQEWTDRSNRDLEDLNFPADVSSLFDKNLRGDERAQMNLIEEMRKVLNKYNKALIQYSQITAFQKADPVSVETLREWVCARDGGKLCIQGAGSNSWGLLKQQPEPALKQLSLKWRFILMLWHLFWPRKLDDNKLDLVVPRQTSKDDSLTGWVANEWAPFMMEVRKTPFYKSVGKLLRDCKTILHIRRRPETHHPCDCQEGSSSFNTFSGYRMVQFTSTVATLVACALPIAAIAVLSKIHSQAETLGIIALFTVSFAGGLMFLAAGASRVEIFTATAAFSAVMVVFVQNQNGGT